MTSSLVDVVTLALALTVSPQAAASLTPAGGGLAPADQRAAAASEEPTVESFAVRGSSLHRVRATVVVRAPIERARAVVFDFARYPEFVPRYEKAFVVGPTPGGGRRVQMELGGVVRLWMRVDISPPALVGGTEVYEGRLHSGNVRAFQPRWELTALPGDRTRLVLESFLDPDLALVPSSMIDQGAREGVRDAAVALKGRMERAVVAAR
jgi:ribosome-associated toxin RatA of RatAB toxin-antitoxin module